MGLQGPYEARFSGSDIPSLNETDLSFFGDLDIEGFVPDSLRGQVSGTVSGIGDSFEKVVHWYNSEAQYWARADSSGAFTSPMMKPGDYSMVLYQTEFRVANTTVQVSEGGTTSQDISSEWSEDYTSIWKIGVYDGQPFEFLNSDLFLRMHPSDDRMNAWALGSAFDVGTSTSDAFPMAIFSDVNNGPVITFDLDAVPNGDVTLRVATTLSFAGGRPGATVNGWESDVPDAPTDVDSRGVTRGAYRGYGDIYEWTVPNDQLNEGSNNVTITVQSGNSGEGFLSPNVVSVRF